MAEESTKKAPQSLIATIIIILIVIWGSYKYVYAPKLKEITKLDTDLQTINKEIITISGDKDVSSEKIKKIKILLQKELEDLSKKIPTEKETPYLLNSFINQVGKGLNIDFKLIQPMGIISEKRYKRIPIRVEFESSYYTFNKYLDQLKGLPATIRIDNLDLYKSGQQDKVSVRMSLSAFVISGGILPKQDKITSETIEFNDPFFPKKVVVAPKATKNTLSVLPLKYTGFWEGKERRAIINNIPLAVGERILGYSVYKIYKDKVILQKSGKLYTLGLNK